MGPIPAQAMQAWLLQGQPPPQLHRPVHRPMLEAVAADPTALLVCGLMAAEVERGVVPGAYQATRWTTACVSLLF